jgi:2-amino-4-hydroxy-6-hydroxymethyldihydropteridine diphosphokinase
LIYLALGANLGNREASLRLARASLAPQARVLAASPIYETAPWGYLEQPPFLNQILQVETSLSPIDLLGHLKQIEDDMGRKPNFHYGPRLIDLDILFYHDQVVNLDGLVIPHPRLTERAFVLVPLADLAPDLRHPISGQTVSDLLASIGRDRVTLYHPTIST